MTSTRYQLERALWKRGLRVGLLPPTSAPSVDVYPVVLPDDVEADAVDRKLNEVAGRLGVSAIRGAWLPDGNYSLELPRAKRARVDYERLSIPNNDAVLPWLLGIDNQGAVIVADVAAMPHCLVAGSTGAGKSNAMNAALAYLTTSTSPEHVNLLLIDPKRVDLLPFRNLPHTIGHIPDIDAVAGALEQLTGEMTRRYRLFEQAGRKDIASYNAKAKHPLPRVVCIIDEWGMLMDSHAKVLEPLMLELLQVSRAAGIHVILGTQRPDADILRARLRGNLPTRVCFRVNDAKSSQLIITDGSGGDLLGAGDGLFRDSDGGLIRFQSPYISEKALDHAVSVASEHKAVAAAAVTVETKPTIDRTLSRYEQAFMLARSLEWICSQDLVDAGICNSQAVGRQVLTELRKAGEIGRYDPSRKAAPTRQQPNTPRNDVRGVRGSVAGVSRVQSTSHTQDNESSGLTAKALAGVGNG